MRSIGRMCGTRCVWPGLSHSSRFWLPNRQVGVYFSISGVLFGFDLLLTHPNNLLVIEMFSYLVAGPTSLLIGLLVSSPVPITVDAEGLTWKQTRRGRMAKEGKAQVSTRITTAAMLAKVRVDRHTQR